MISQFKKENSNYFYESISIMHSLDYIKKDYARGIQDSETMTLIQVKREIQSGNW